MDRWHLGHASTRSYDGSLSSSFIPAGRLGTDPLSPRASLCRIGPRRQGFASPLRALDRCGPIWRDALFTSTCEDARSTHARRSPFCGLGTRGLAFQATSDSGAGTEIQLDATPTAVPSQASYRATESAPSVRCAWPGSSCPCAMLALHLTLPGRFSFRALNAELSFEPLHGFFLIFDVRAPDVPKESATIRRDRSAILCALITRTAERTQIRLFVASAVLVVNDVADMQADCPARVGIIRIACASSAHLTGEAVTFKH